MFASKIILSLLIVYSEEEFCLAQVYDDDSCFYDLGNALLSDLFQLTTDVIELLTNQVISLQLLKNNITFYFLTPDNTSIPLNSPNSLLLLNQKYPTKIIIHGWTSSYTNPLVLNMAFAYNIIGNFNVIAVDWSFPASMNYVLAAAYTQIVGDILGDFITENSISLQNVHLIGHSLGAHVAGFAGKKVENNTGNSVSRVTGLEAAGPLFTLPLVKSSDCRLDVSDADFVDLLHTTTIVGTTHSLGDADFFINDGHTQLNCSDDLPNIFQEEFCDHDSAPIYFTTSIFNPDAYPAEKCTGDDNLTCYPDQIAYMGNAVSQSASGTYYINLDKEGNVI